MTTPTYAATATGPDISVGGEKLPRRVQPDGGLRLVVPAVAGDTIEVTATASADPLVTLPIELDVLVLDAKGRDRRALSGSWSADGIATGLSGWSIPGRSDQAVTLNHAFEVQDSDLVDDAVHLDLVATSFTMRRLHIDTAPLTFSAQVTAPTTSSKESHR